MQVLEAHLLQKCDDLQTSPAVMTNDDRGMRAVESVDLVWNVLHGHEFAAIDACQIEFPRFADVEQTRARQFVCLQQDL